MYAANDSMLPEKTDGMDTAFKRRRLSQETGHNLTSYVLNTWTYKESPDEVDTRGQASISATPMTLLAETHRVRLEDISPIRRSRSTEHASLNITERRRSLSLNRVRSLEDLPKCIQMVKRFQKLADVSINRPHKREVMSSERTDERRTCVRSPMTIVSPTEPPSTRPGWSSVECTARDGSGLVLRGQQCTWNSDIAERPLSSDYPREPSSLQERQPQKVKCAHDKISSPSVTLEFANIPQTTPLLTGTASQETVLSVFSTAPAPPPYMDDIFFQNGPRSKRKFAFLEPLVKHFRTGPAELQSIPEAPSATSNIEQTVLPGRYATEVRQTRVLPMNRRLRHPGYPYFYRSDRPMTYTIPSYSDRPLFEGINRQYEPVQTSRYYNYGIPMTDISAQTQQAGTYLAYPGGLQREIAQPVRENTVGGLPIGMRPRFIYLPQQGYLPLQERAPEETSLFYGPETSVTGSSAPLMLGAPPQRMAFPEARTHRGSQQPPFLPWAPVPAMPSQERKGFRQMPLSQLQEEPTKFRKPAPPIIMLETPEGYSEVADVVPAVGSITPYTPSDLSGAPSPVVPLQQTIMPPVTTSNAATAMPSISLLKRTPQQEIYQAGAQVPRVPSAGTVTNGTQRDAAAKSAAATVEGTPYEGVRSASWESVLATQFEGKARGATPSYHVETPQILGFTGSQIHMLQAYRKSRRDLMNWVVCGVVALSMVLIFMVLLCAWAYSKPRFTEESLSNMVVFNELTRQRYRARDPVEKFLLKQVSANVLRLYLKEITKMVHVAGTERQRSIAEYVKSVWTSYGLYTSMEKYSVMLSLPDDQLENQFDVIDGNGQTFLKSKGNVSGVFNAYSPGGDVKANLLYCNRCMPDDFVDLDRMGASASGKICLCRYSSNMTVGDAAKAVDDAGVAATLFFMDPKDVAPNPDQGTYPNSWWMPRESVRQANMRYLYDIGDPTTNGYASRDDYQMLYRGDVRDVRLPQALSQPIGYGDAEDIMKRLGGRPCPNGWAPELEGSCFIGDGSSISAHLQLHNRLARTTIHNVLAYITGVVEPDRYVVLGVPLDSWSHGAVTPGTGLAQALEVSRILQKLRKKKRWLPARTIVFVGWDAHHFGDIGATEFVEAHRQKLMLQTVLYLNSEICTSGKKFLVTASPSVASSLEQMFRRVVSSDKGMQRDREGEEFRLQLTTSEVEQLRASGSHLPFVRYAGVPSVDVLFGNHSKDGYYPALGTAQDTYDLVAKFIDKKFEVQRICAQVIAITLRRWADSLLLPYDLRRLKWEMFRAFRRVRDQYSENLTNWQVDLEPVRGALMRLDDKISEFLNFRSRANLKNPFRIRRLNDMLLELERTFLLGVSGAPGVGQNVIYGPSQTSPLRMVFFPELRNLLGVTPSDIVKHIEDLKTQVSYILQSLHQAADVINIEEII
ncbi:uncharacterized protein LOC135385453 [Ornithodoros turicata]|uniref:uncharacterized protein LOC135385453 n=1 Tax=Ornithodoros turicata TaxID=34597 RepID=UPI0031390399